MSSILFVALLLFVAVMIVLAFRRSQGEADAAESEATAWTPLPTAKADDPRVLLLVNNYFLPKLLLVKDWEGFGDDLPAIQALEVSVFSDTLVWLMDHFGIDPLTVIVRATVGHAATEKIEQRFSLEGETAELARQEIRRYYDDPEIKRLAFSRAP